MQRTDKHITMDLVDELYWDTRLNASKVNVSVHHGVVTLTGQVPTYADSLAAEAAAWRIGGVIDVINETIISYVLPPPLPVDEQIRTQTENLLAWDPVIDEMDIAVTVLHGGVTLEGTVNAHWKRSYIEQKIAGLRGVLAVDNKLAVVPTETISDAVIATDIVAAFDRDLRVRAQDVEVEVDNGIVTLSGSVPDWEARRAAEANASFTAGVMDVRNRLKLAA